jgi:hypothetical protein
MALGSRSFAVLPRRLVRRRRVPRGRARLAGSRLAALGILLAALAIPVPPTVAQPAEDASGRVLQIGPVEITPLPYLWLPWTSIDVHPSNGRIRSRSTTIDPGQLITHLTWVPFMGAVEFRSGRFGLLVDYIHAPAKAGISTRDVLFGSGSENPVLDSGTAVFLFRPVVSPEQSLDAGLGVRAWGFGGSVALSQGLLRPVTVSSGMAWADPLIAMRYRRDLGEGYGATLYGDFGGFGVGAHVDWQLIGTIDCTVRSWLDLHAGFRSLNFAYGNGRADFHVNMYGPFLSAVIRF